MLCSGHERRWAVRIGCSGTYPSEASVLVSPSLPFAQHFEIRILPSFHSKSDQVKENAKCAPVHKASKLVQGWNPGWSIQSRLGPCYGASLRRRRASVVFDPRNKEHHSAGRFTWYRKSEDPLWRTSFFRSAGSRLSRGHVSRRTALILYGNVGCGGVDDSNWSARYRGRYCNEASET